MLNESSFDQPISENFADFILEPVQIINTLMIHLQLFCQIALQYGGRKSQERGAWMGIEENELLNETDCRDSKAQ